VCLWRRNCRFSHTCCFVPRILCSVAGDSEAP
jgi:hypothetical protein